MHLFKLKRLTKWVTKQLKQSTLEDYSSDHCQMAQQWLLIPLFSKSEHSPVTKRSSRLRPIIVVLTNWEQMFLSFFKGSTSSHLARSVTFPQSKPGWLAKTSWAQIRSFVQSLERHKEGQPAAWNICIPVPAELLPAAHSRVSRGRIPVHTLRGDAG